MLTLDEQPTWWPGKTIDTSCRLWPVQRDGHGRPRRRRNGKWVLHVRWLAAQIYGCDAIENMIVMHLCDQPSCVRFDHLYVGTQADNNADRAAKARNGNMNGERSGMAKLTNEQVVEMRRLRAGGMILRELATMYPVTISTISKICRGDTWGGV